MKPVWLAAVAVSLILARGGVSDPDTEAPVIDYSLTPDIPYREFENPTPHEDERCRLDLYRPVNVTGYPTVVWFHPGGLKLFERSVPEELKAQGLAVVAGGYRLSPHVEAPVYIEDAAAVVAWTFEHIEELGGDPERVYVAGASAGGYLALMLTLDKSYLAAHGVDADRIRGVISFSGQAINHVAVREERGITRDRPVVDELAPLYHVRGDAPPLLLITGDRELELLGRYEENAYLWRMLKLVGHEDVTLYELEGHDHPQMTPPSFPLLLRFVERLEGRGRSE